MTRAYYVLFLCLVVLVKAGVAQAGDPEEARKAFFVGASMVDAGEHEEAIPWLEQSIDEDAGFCRAYFYLALCYAERGSADGDRTAIDHAEEYEACASTGEAEDVQRLWSLMPERGSGGSAPPPDDPPPPPPEDDGYGRSGSDSSDRRDDDDESYGRSDSRRDDDDDSYGRSDSRRDDDDDRGSSGRSDSADDDRGSSGRSDSGDDDRSSSRSDDDDDYRSRRYGRRDSDRSSSKSSKSDRGKSDRGKSDRGKSDRDDRGKGGDSDWDEDEDEFAYLLDDLDEDDSSSRRSDDDDSYRPSTTGGSATVRSKVPAWKKRKIAGGIIMGAGAGAAAGGFIMSAVMYRSYYWETDTALYGWARNNTIIGTAIGVGGAAAGITGFVVMVATKKDSYGALVLPGPVTTFTMSF